MAIDEQPGRTERQSGAYGAEAANSPRGMERRTRNGPVGAEWQGEVAITAVDARSVSPDRGAPAFGLSRLQDWSREQSLWPLMMGLACCAIEMMASSASRYDIARFGSELFRPSPRQADLMIVSGRVAQKMAPVLREIYDQMPDPKWVIAMGDCASCGGVFNNYAILQGVDKVVPVDVYVPGCPPRPEALLDGILKLKERIGKGQA